MPTPSAADASRVALHALKSFAPALRHLLRNNTPRRPRTGVAILQTVPTDYTILGGVADDVEIAMA